MGLVEIKRERGLDPGVFVCFPIPPRGLREVSSDSEAERYKKISLHHIPPTPLNKGGLLYLSPPFLREVPSDSEAEGYKTTSLYHIRGTFRLNAELRTLNFELFIVNS